MRLINEEPFTLSAKAFDPDTVHGDELRYEWFVDGRGLVGVGMNITLNLGEGTYTVRLRVIDSYNRTLEVTREITVDGPRKGSMNPFIIASITLVLLLVLLIALFVFRRRSERERSIKELSVAQMFIDPEPPVGPMKRPLPFHGEIEVRAGPLGPFPSNSECVNITSLESAPFEGVRLPLDERREGLKLLLAAKRDELDDETYNALRGMIWEE
jgi:hypothetical protein